MTEHLHEIEQQLRNCEIDIYNTAVEYRGQARDAAEKRSDYDAAYAKAMLNIVTQCDATGTKMTVAEKEALAVKAVENEMLQCRIAEGLAEGTKRHLEALQAILSSVQTRSRLIVTERSLTNYA